MIKFTNVKNEKCTKQQHQIKIVRNATNHIADKN